MCATQVDEITNIVTDVTGDPTLPRLIETSCSVTISNAKALISQLQSALPRSNDRPCPECRHREAVFFQVNSDYTSQCGCQLSCTSTHRYSLSLTPRKQRRRWSSTTSAPTPTATIDGRSKFFATYSDHHILQAKRQINLQQKHLICYSKKTFLVHSFGRYWLDCRLPLKQLIEKERPLHILSCYWGFVGVCPICT